MWSRFQSCVKLCALAFSFDAGYILAQDGHIGADRPPVLDISPVDRDLTSVEGEHNITPQGHQVIWETSRWEDAVSDSPKAAEVVAPIIQASPLKVMVGVDFLAVASTKRVFPRGLPLLVLPDSPFGEDTNSFSMHARQSFVNAALTGPQIGSFQTSGNVLAFFQNDNLTSDDYGLLVYFAFAELKNDCWRIAAGLQQDVFNPVSPNVLYLTKLYASGNTGSYRGQLRLERDFASSHGFDMLVQMALSDPLSFLVTDDLGRLTEDNGWPNVEARVQLGIGEQRDIRGTQTSPVQIGMSGLVGQIRTATTILGPPSSLPPRAVIDVWGVGTDAQLAIGERLGVVTEFFVGQGLGDYNGGILQSFNSTTYSPVNSVGGFGEIYYYMNPNLHLHLGYGIDDPRNADLSSVQPLRNETYYTSLIWDVSAAMQIGIEIDYRETSYTRFLPNAFIDADAVLVGSRLLWRF